MKTLVATEGAAYLAVGRRFVASGLEGAEAEPAILAASVAELAPETACL